MSIIPLTETVVQLAKNINLYSSVAKSQIAAEAMTYVGEVLKANMLHVTQELSLQSNPAGFVLMTSLHESRSDLVNHYTVDVYRKEYQESTTLDRPIGVVHVYENYGLKVFRQPRSKAVAAYKAAASATSETGTNATTS